MQKGLGGPLSGTGNGALHFMHAVITGAPQSPHRSGSVIDRSDPLYKSAQPDSGNSCRLTGSMTWKLIQCPRLHTAAKKRSATRTGLPPAPDLERHYEHGQPSLYHLPVRVIALGAATVLLSLVGCSSSSPPSGSQGQGGPLCEFVATRDIPKNTLGTSIVAAGGITPHLVPRKEWPTDAIIDLNLLDGKIALVAIAKGAPILHAQFANIGSVTAKGLDLSNPGSAPSKGNFGPLC